jgi:GAF domain-containing protein
MTGATGVHLLLWSDDQQDWLRPAPPAADVTVAAGGKDPERGLPMSVLRYVQRTREPLVVDDALRDDRFARDPYFTDITCCSVLAVPIVSRGVLQAVLVLENRLMRGSFTAARLDGVKLIAGQLAVSVDNAHLYAEFRQIADDQAALRRVATLVARGAEPSEVFGAVTDEARRCLRMATVGLWRFEANGEITLLAAAADRDLLAKWPAGTRTPVKGDNLASAVLSTGRPARMDDYENATGPIAARVRELGVRATVGVPIIIDGRVWGLAAAGSVTPGPMPADTEARIADFADLVATAIVNAATRSQLHASQDELRMLAEQQAALRRVATLVARGTSPSDLFAVVAEEVARVVDVPFVVVARYDVDDTATDCASFPPASGISTGGTRWSLGGTNIMSLVRDSSAPARIDDYSQLDGEIANEARRVGLNSTVGVPIVVAGRLWGAMVGSTFTDPLPDDTAERLARFTELLATAIANAESREALGRLADVQAALRRVAELVAREVSPAEVFSAVAEEMARCLDVDNASVCRYEADAVVVAAFSRADSRVGSRMPDRVFVGERFPLDGDHIGAMVLRTGRSARLDSHQHASGAAAARIRELGVQCAVGVPIVVGGHLWGMAAATSRAEPLPTDIDTGMADFADLVATAIANAATRDELLASRARIVAAADDARRRLERDLHDGAQQRLVALGLGLRAAEACVPDELQSLKERIAGLVTTAAAVSAEVQEISRGIHPAILSKGGLGPALKTLARRCAVPVNLDIHVDQRFADSIEVGAYYVVAEALTNAAKHARASVVEVCAQATDTTLRLVIRDDGIGGAAAGGGSGLIGLVDRVEALGGKMTIQSPAGRGTSLLVNIPIETV